MDRSCRFDGKSVIVTGAGMGIGKGTAIAFAREASTLWSGGRWPAPSDHAA